jgi:hypothetical protein
LAAKEAKLQQKIEEARRELARLNEQQTANQLKDAADQLQKAQDMGGNPEQDLQKAADDLNKAKQQIQQAQEELARELLVKMADQLEGIKLREVASLERTEKLHTKVLRDKLWSEGLLDTMAGNIDAQKGIGDDTDNLKDKLKEAKVFHAILGKAKKSMDDAGDVMTKRRDEGKDRQGPEMMNEAELKDEAEWQKDTVGYQKHAIKRLDNLLESIKEEIARMDKKKEQKDKDGKPENPPDPENPPKDKEPQGGMRPRDGIPPMAELKALRAEQLDLNERTEAFAKKYNLDNLDDKAKAELADLSREQTAIHELFQQILPRPAEPAGDPNEQKKEKEKKGDAK